MNYDYFFQGNSPIAINLRNYSNCIIALNDSNYSIYWNQNDNYENYNYCCQFVADLQVYHSYIYVTSTYAYLVSTNYNDVIKVRNIDTPDNQVIAYNVGDNLTARFNTLSDQVSYLAYGTQTAQDSQYMNYEDYSVLLDDGEVLYYDFSNCYYPDDSNYLTYLNNIYYDSSTNQSYSFYYSVIRLQKYNIALNFGRPYQNSNTTSYYSGYGEGYTDGYTKGFNDGQVIAPVGNQTATAFSFIGGAFNAVSNVLALEVLPHVTLGICFSIPVVLVLIMTIFKLVKK